MDSMIKEIIIGNKSIKELDTIIDQDYNVQNERYIKVVRIFINKIKSQINNGIIKIEEINNYLTSFNNLSLNYNSSFNKYLIGQNIADSEIENEINKLLKINVKTSLEDLDDMFAFEEKETVINENVNNEQISNETKPLTAEQISVYRQFKDILDRDLEFGIITLEQARAYGLIIQEESVSNEIGKTLVKSNRTNIHKTIDLGYIEPLILSLIVSSIGLLYVGYLYLMV